MRSIGAFLICCLGTGLFSSEKDAVMSSLVTGETEKALKIIRERKEKFTAGEIVFMESLAAFFGGDYPKSRELSGRPDFPEGEETGYWKDLIGKTWQRHREFREFSTPHFSIRVTEKDLLLARYLEKYLEKIYAEIGALFRYSPEEKIIVEVYPDKESFQDCSTLSYEELKRSGTIGICKFNRIMILSPRLLAYGYSWVDSLAHEYVHWILSKITHMNLPLWLNEGVAKWAEKKWRAANDSYPDSFTSTYLARLKEGEWIPFSDFLYGMPSLENQEKISLAFTEVSFLVRHAEEEHGKDRLIDFLHGLGGKTEFEEAFKKHFGKEITLFVEEGKEALAKKEWTKYNGVLSPYPVFEGEPSPLFSSSDYMTLGDRLRGRGRLNLALREYSKGLIREPENGILLTKAGKTEMESGEKEKGIATLKEALKYAPNYLPLRTALYRFYAGEKNLPMARQELEEIVLINPYYPEIKKWEQETELLP